MANRMLASSAAARSAAALDLVGRDPWLALAEADAVLADDAAGGDAAASSRAHRAAGLALRELGDLPLAEARLRTAVQLAGRAGAGQVAAEARMSLAFVLLDRGRARAALTQADRADTGLSGLGATRLGCQRALILQRMGRLDEALAAYAALLPALRKADDTLWEARVCNNRGLLHAHRGSLAAAEADFARACALYAALGMDLLVAESECNLGNVAAVRGDAPAALACYDRAERVPVLNRKPRPQLLLNRCQVLLRVGLFEEARQVAARAVNELRAADQQADLAEARLWLAETSAACGQPVAAETEAGGARLAFTRQGRSGWAALARLVALRAAEARDARTRSLVRAARACAAELGAAGWPVAKLDAELIAATAALRAGDVDGARTILEPAGHARRSGPLEMRVRSWHAHALLREAAGDRRGALAALRAGLALVERRQAVLGATEMRVHISVFGAELAARGLQLALATKDPRNVLGWTERWRARALRLRPVRPPDDPELADALAELRRLARHSAQDQLSGRPGPAGATYRAAEERVVAASRVTRSRLHQPEDPPPSSSQLLAALGGRALVEFVQRDGELLAVTLRRGRCRLRRVAPLDAVTAEIDTATAALRTLALTFGTARGRSVIRAAADRAGRALDRLLFDPLDADVGERPLVIVPTGGLHAVPWGLLPRLAHRPVSVAPSAAAWLRAVGSSGNRGGRAVFVAGPGLPAARTEVSAVAARHPGATTLLGGQATVPAVLAALDKADLAHIAAHGNLRSDNPLLSALELDDGPLTAYDLESLSRTPSVVVLPACSSGVSAVHPGDELLGLISVLLALGTRTVIATATLVSDVDADPIMRTLHERLLAGGSPAEALAAARSAVAQGDDGASAAAASFVCFGA